MRVDFEEYRIDLYLVTVTRVGRNGRRRRRSAKSDFEYKGRTTARNSGSFGRELFRRPQERSKLMPQVVEQRSKRYKEAAKKAVTDAGRRSTRRSTRQGVQAHQVRPVGRADLLPRHRPQAGRPDDPRLAVAAARHRQEQAGRRVLPRAPGRRGASNAGAIRAGGQELVAEIEKENFTDFDVAIATPDMMRFVGRLGKVLGPKGLMPSPKAGTVTPDVGNAVREYAAGKVEFRNDAGGNVHSVVGKVSFDKPEARRQHQRDGRPDPQDEAADQQGRTTSRRSSSRRR